MVIHQGKVKRIRRKRKDFEEIHLASIKKIEFEMREMEQSLRDKKILKRIGPL